MNGRPEPFLRGIRDCGQDSCESHFCSIGGLENRTNMTAPKYILENEVEAYLEGVCTPGKGHVWG